MSLPNPAAGAVMIYDSVSGGVITSNGYASPLVMPPVPSACDVNGITNHNTSSQSQVTVANTAYYIAGSQLPMPATYMTGIQSGSVLKWRVAMTKTNAGTVAFDILIYMGTHGSTADTAIVTQSIGVQTAAVDDMIVDVMVAFTSTTACYWTICPLNKAVTATGFGVATGASAFTSGTVSALTTTTPSLVFGLGFNSTTGTPTVVIPMVEAQAYNIT